MTSAQIDTIQALENENKILADEVKMKEDLIPGMEKMIAYLQKIQEENKRLKEEWVDPATVVQWEQAQVWLEENKRLKEENKILRKGNETYMETINGVINTAMGAKGEQQQEIDELKEEMKEYKEYYEKWSEILSEVDGDDFCNLLQECGWEENDDGELVRVTDK